MAHVVLIESKLTGGFEIIKQAAAAGHRLTFVTSELAAYLRGAAVEKTDLRFAARVLEADDTSSSEALWPAIEALDGEEKIGAILTISEPHLVATSELAARLGLRHVRPETARKTRDKRLTRQTLHARGVPQPRFRLAASAAEAATAAAELGYPVVAKPVDGSGSINAGVFSDRAALQSHVEKALALESYGRSVRAQRLLLIEEFVAGPLVSCETLTIDGVHHVLGVTDRRLSPPPVLAELGGCFPAAVPRQDEVVKVCLAALDALGFDYGAAHTEIVIGARGPVIIEVNGRLVGGLVPEVIDAALGSQVYVDLIALHLGAKSLPILDRVKAPRGVASIRALCAPATGRLAAIETSRLLSDPRLKHFSLSCKVGDHVRTLDSNRGRLGFLITLDRTQAASNDLAQRILDTTLLRVEAAA